MRDEAMRGKGGRVKGLGGGGKEKRVKKQR